MTTNSESLLDPYFPDKTSDPDLMFLTEKGFAQLASFCTEQLGIKMPSSKISMVRSRLTRRVRELGIASIEGYVRYVFNEGHSEERSFIVDALTTHKTDFFREPQHFEYLAEVALPSLHQHSDMRPTFRMWSSACSSGEEPYSMAMTASEYCEQNNARYTMLATDISERVLRIARRGVYPEVLIEPVPDALRRKYLRKKATDNQHMVRVVPSLRENISFYSLNLIAGDYGIAEKFDIIFLRNVLIYFNRERQQQIVQSISRYLAPGGYIFISHSESLANMDIPVKRVETSILQMPYE